MALHMVLLLLWVCLFHSVVDQDYRDVYTPAIGTISRFPEVREGKCVFPFHYKKGTFYDCVKFNARHEWCSLNKTYEGYWKYCSKEDFAKCMFPFWYRRIIYHECTEDGESFGKKWCSLTQNYNKDKIWKYCD